MAFDARTECLRMKNWSYSLFCIMLCMLFVSFLIVTVYADTPPLPANPWRIELGNDLVFHGTPTEYESQGYPKTGLYHNGELIYTVDASLQMRIDRNLNGQLFFANDGMTFLEVVWRVAASGSPGVAIRYREPIEPAVHFFSHGDLVHSHEVFDLVRNQSKIIYSVSHAQWDYQNERVHSLERNTLQVLTRDGRRIIFDLSTGLIVPAPSHLRIVLAGGILVIAVAAILIVMRKSKYIHKKGVLKDGST